MRRLNSAICVVSLGVFGLTQAGCTNTAPETKHTPSANEHGHEGHDHGDHDHGHEHGAHGGEIVVVEPGDIKVEWTHNHDDGDLTIYVVDKKAESAYINIEMEGKEPKKYELKAGSEANSFSIKDTELVTVIDASETEGSGIKPSVAITADGAEHKAVLKVMHHH